MRSFNVWVVCRRAAAGQDFGDGQCGPALRRPVTWGSTVPAYALHGVKYIDLVALMTHRLHARLPHVRIGLGRASYALYGLSIYT